MYLVVSSNSGKQIDSECINMADLICCRCEAATTLLICSRQEGLFKHSAYTFKRRILIQVLPPPNTYTKSANGCIHEQTTKEFGKMNTCISRFGRRKYLNE